MRCTAVIPAYNESTRILGVLNILVQAGNVSEIIVVNDASSDDTANVARQFAKTAPKQVRVFDMPTNAGKGAAMHRGASETDAEVVLFLDADLVGLSVEMVQNMTAGVIAGEADMTLGVFRGGRRAEGKPPAIKDLPAFLQVGRTHSAQSGQPRHWHQPACRITPRCGHADSDRQSHPAKRARGFF